MAKNSEQKKSGGIEENLKKALTELLILRLFAEREHYIGELSPLLHDRSGGVLNIVFPYAAIYRMTQAGSLTETKKRTAPDGRLRQYYRLTDQGRVRLEEMQAAYRAFTQGVDHILSWEVHPAADSASGP